MNKPIIEIDNISKLYQVGSLGYRTLRESINQWWERRRGIVTPQLPGAGVHPAQKGPFPNTFWAVRNISASIQQGEVVGIIGRNGAGKSTLLKILSRITEPTEGRVTMRGRVGSLLEVGAGFHAELSGRENIFLNGAILGMKKADITRKLDDIIEFADVGAFIDTPVKRYSSGMYVRLAFAVAAHLEPDILIIDEVLAVGDMRFQKKCLGKIQEISSAHGRTVIFVSHSLESVQRLCSHCMLLEHGQVITYGPTDRAVADYLDAKLPFARAGTWIDVSKARREGTGEARFSQVRFSSHHARTSGQPCSDCPIEFELAIETSRRTTFQSVAVAFLDNQGRQLVNADGGTLGETFTLAPGKTVLRLRIEQLHLRPGVYCLALWLARYAGERISKSDIIDWVEKAFELEVIELTTGVPGTFTGLTALTAPVTCKFELREIMRPAERRDPVNSPQI